VKNRRKKENHSKPRECKYVPVYPYSRTAVQLQYIVEPWPPRRVDRGAAVVVEERAKYFSSKIYSGGILVYPNHTE
jgi:hypothetical protein